MRSRAIAASAVLATGLMGLGGTAFADGGQTANTDNAEDTAPDTTRVEPASNTQAVTTPDRSVIGLNVPVAADLHEGVANDLNVHDVARDAVHLGDTLPAPTAGADAGGQPEDVTTLPADNQADVKAASSATAQGTDAATAQATAVHLGGAVNGVVSSATATVNSLGVSAGR